MGSDRRRVGRRPRAGQRFGGLWHKGVYRYAAYRFQAGGETVTQPVIDWVGEEPMPGEAFTYVLEYGRSRPLLQRIQLVDVVQEE